MQRVIWIDFIRGVAIFLMVIFHFIFDLNYFGFIDIEIKKGFFKYFRLLIVVLFLSIVGVSLYLSYHKGIDFYKFRKRLLLLFVSSVAISVATYFIFSKSWIYFGVIHFILVATIFGVFFVKIPKVSLFVGVLILVLYYYDFLNLRFLYLFLKPYLHLPTYTEDIVRFFPWFGVVLIGIFLGYTKVLHFKYKCNKICQVVSLWGRHSLMIYLTHQIILFGGFEIINYLTRGRL